MRILVVDDEPNFREMLSTFLIAEGHEVEAVGESGAAISKGVDHSFDLALVDLRIGIESGIELIAMLLAQRPQLKIVVITSHGTIASAIEAVRRGALDFIAKPFTPEQIRILLDRVSRACNLE